MAHTKRVLVVDDQRPVAEMLLAVLRAEGFVVQACVASAEAVDQAAHFQPHLIILDLVMPERSGADVLRELRARPETSDTPVLLVTAFPSAGRLLGNDHVERLRFMTKPFDIDELMERVRELMDG